MTKGSVAPFIEKYYPEYYMLKEYPVVDCAPIRANTDEWGILSNIYPTVLVVDGVEFASSEQLFQMMKFADKDILLDIYCKIYSISKPYYDYLVSVLVNQTNDKGIQDGMIDLGIADPVKVYSNIIGGIGILGCYTKSESEIDVIKITGSFPEKK